MGHRRHRPIWSRAGLVLAVLMFDTMGAIVKYLSANYPPQQLSLFRNLFGHCRARRYCSPPAPGTWPVGRGGSGNGGWVDARRLCRARAIRFYAALGHLAFATATTLAFAGPDHHRPVGAGSGSAVGPWRWSAVVIGFAGVVLIMRPGADVFSLHALLPLGAAFGYACSSVTVQRFDRDVPSPLINLYGTGGALVGAAALVLFSGGFVPVAGPQDWLWLIAMGGLGGCAVLCLITAIAAPDPAIWRHWNISASPFLHPGWAIFDEAPFDRLWPGAMLVVGAGLLIIWREGCTPAASAERALSPGWSYARLGPWTLFPSSTRISISGTTAPAVTHGSPGPVTRTFSSAITALCDAITCPPTIGATLATCRSSSWSIARPNGIATIRSAKPRG